MFEITSDMGRALEKLNNRTRSGVKGVEQRTARIMKEIQKHKDQALRKFTLRFDGCWIHNIRVSEGEFEAAYRNIDGRFLDSLRNAIASIRVFHERQSQDSFFWEKEPGILLGQYVTPLERVGIYVPGGTAPLVSSVLMNAIPAAVAGVSQIIMCTPPRKDGTIDSYRLVAARESGVTEVYKAGGAQAVFAMALGTESILRVDKITGPGNVYVACAKKMAFGFCGIDMVAGPSEILVIADESADPTYVAADLLGQAEHDPMAACVLCCPSMEFAGKVNLEAARMLKSLTRKDIIRQSVRDYGIIYVYRELDEAFECANYMAPEHLELQITDAISYLEKIRHAGAVFLGPFTPEALGDYLAGPNHTLPTGGTARFSSPLGVQDFVKRTSILRYDHHALEKAQTDIRAFTMAEGLDAHFASVSVRFQGGNP